MRTSMKRVVIYSAVLLGFSTLLVQCVATQQDVEYTNVKVRKMDTKVEDINKERIKQFILREHEAVSSV